MPNKTVYEGQLEIDYNAGVIYFHSNEGMTILRITHLLTPMPFGKGIDMVSVPHLTSYPPLEFRPTVKPDAQVFTDRCPVCHQVHTGRSYFRARNGDTMVAGHEYEITTKMSTEKYARVWRMGFLGEGISGYQFDAHGPDRQTDRPYGGTQAILKDSLLTAKEVDLDKAKRHTAERPLR
jgi:hypothetical protein